MGDCIRCGGTGLIEAGCYTCPNCRGTGFVDEEENNEILEREEKKC